MQTKEQHCPGVPLRLLEHGQEVGAAHEYQGSSVVQHDEEVHGGWEHTSQDHHQHSEVLVHSLEQPVKSHREKDADGPGDQIADDAEAEERLVRGDVAGGRGRVPMHEQGAGNVEEAYGGGDGEEEIEETGHYGVLAGGGH